MSKDKIADYDGTTAGNNTDIGGISIAEGMLPSAVNNSMRELTKQLGAFANGTDPIDALTVTGAATVGNGLTVDDDGATVLTVDRASSEGTVVDLQKDGTTFGTLGIDGSDLVIDGPSGHTGLRMTTSGLLPRQNGAIIDNTIDLGSGAYRYNDLYLGGNLYLGGTGSANALDDYEFGTFDPDLACSGTNFSSRTVGGRGGYYEKVGNAVSTYIYFELSAFTLGSGSGNMKITGLPFSASTARSGSGGGGACAFHGVNVGSTVFNAMAYASGSEVLFLVSRDQTTWVNIQIGDIHSGTIFAVWFQLNYYVD